MLVGILLLLASVWLLRGDAVPFLRWYFVILMMGIGFYPVSSLLFDSFYDHGWLFSKVLAMAVCGYIVWLFVTSGLQHFSSRRCIVITLIAFGICWVRFMDRERRDAPRLDLILTEEVLFLALLLFWTYCIGFRAEAIGTEKFMDYGFLASMERSSTLPAKDIWYGLEPVNYYYGGLYYTAYLSKLSYLPTRLTYSLMRATIAAFAFTMPFSIVYHLVDARLRDHMTGQKWSMFGGVLAGTAVSLAGNLHYVLYGLFGKILQLPGYEDYWFPSSTRYIGHNPETTDHCIHEFPSYSTVLGDLHAHYINLLFVLTILGLLYAWVRQVRMLELDRLEQQRIREEQQRRRPSKYESQKSWRLFWKRNGIESQLLAAAFLIGLCKWTNYWDYIIYLTVAAFVIALVALYRYQNNSKRALASFFLHIAEVFLLVTLVPLPFMMRFDTMYMGIGIAQNHSRMYQLAILWGLPLCLSLFLLAVTVVRHRQKRKKLTADERQTSGFFSFFRYAPQSDRFVLVLALCALGLILIPELVYVRDIYENGHSRANTMFKLTYQAYVLFGLVMAYTLVRLLAMAKHRWLQGLTLGLLALFGLTVGYLPYSIDCWFGNIFSRDGYQGIDVTAFIERTYPEDAGAIDWLRTYVKEQPLVMEAPGDSYTDYCRVSAMTGLPTLEGWYVHEWLWRNDTEDLNEKKEEIRAIYEAEDPYEALRLLRRYQISYLFVGSKERESYDVQDDVLTGLGEVVYHEGDTYILDLGLSSGER